MSVLYLSPLSLTHTRTRTGFFSPPARILNSSLLCAHCCFRGHVWARGHAWFEGSVWRDLNTKPVVTQHGCKLETWLLHFFQKNFTCTIVECLVLLMVPLAHFLRVVPPALADVRALGVITEGMLRRFGRCTYPWYYSVSVKLNLHVIN